MSGCQDLSALSGNHSAIPTDHPPNQSSAPRNANAGRNRECTWSKDEDERLLSIYDAMKNCAGNGTQRPCLDFEDDEIWSSISSELSSRTAVQCLLRFMKLTETKRISGVACTLVTYNKRFYGDLKSPSSASSSGSSRKKFKHDEMDNDWTEEETDRLEELMSSYQDSTTTPDWHAIANHFPGKTTIDCLSQWQNISLPDQIKGKGSWTPSEDAILREKRAEYGRKWSKIAEYLPGRNGKQCRERFVNHLDRSLKRGEWTDDEEAVLIAMHEHYGNKWTLISRQLPGRSDNDVKNHYYSTIKRKFDLHGKSKLITAAIEHVYMLVDDGRLDADVVKDWKKAEDSCVHNMPDPVLRGAYAAPVHAIPHPPPDQAVPVLYNYDPMHFPHPPIVPMYPTAIFPVHPVGIAEPQQYVPPMLYPDPNNVQPIVNNQTDLGYNHET